MSVKGRKLACGEPLKNLHYYKKCFRRYAIFIFRERHKNYLLKYMSLFGGGRSISEVDKKNDRLLRSIYGGCNFIFGKLPELAIP
jgi:hypothetical protein